MNLSIKLGFVSVNGSRETYFVKALRSSWKKALHKHYFNICEMLAALAQMVAYLPLVQPVRGSIPGGVVKFQPRS